MTAFFLSRVNRILSDRVEVSSFGFAYLIIILCGTLTLLAPFVSAQGPTSGGFSGIVKDKATGLPIEGATATFRNLETNSQTTAISDALGYFSKSSLAPGNYEIVVRANGYMIETKSQTLYATRDNVVKPIPFDLTKEPPPIPIANPSLPTPTPIPIQTPNVAANREMRADEDEVILLNPRRSGAFNQNSLSKIPLGGRSLTRTFDEAAFLVAGVYDPPQAVGSSVGPGVGSGVGTSGQFAVNGLRSRANNFTVDGSDNNDEDIGVRRQGFFALVPQPIESIQEFQIITLLAPAEFGRNLGAQVNALSKSGSNRFNGTVYGLANADFLNARNIFDNFDGNTSFALQGRRLDGALIPVFLDNQPIVVKNDAGERDPFSLLKGGFAVGGPVIRNKMFFFASGEGLHMDGTRERHFAVPTVAERGILGSGSQGFIADLSGGFVLPILPTNLQGDAVFSVFPFPNDPTGVYGPNTYTKALSIDAKGLVLSGKIDWNAFKLNWNQHVLTTRYNFTTDDRKLTDVGGALFSAIRPLVRTDNLSTYLSGSLINNLSNELRISFGRTRLRFEELRDDFLLPVSSFESATDTRFLLNAPYISNKTFATCAPTPPFPFSHCLPSTVIFRDRVSYASQFAFRDDATGGGFETEDSILGPVGQVIIGGFSPAGVDVFNFPQTRENVTYQFANTLRWKHSGIGAHYDAFGIDIRRTFLASDLPRNSRTLVTFYGGRCTNPASFCSQTSEFAQPLDFVAAGAPTGFFQSLVQAGKDAQIDLSFYQLNLFALEEWRVLNNLSFSFGLRYEFNTTPSEAERKIENTFNAALPGFLSGLDAFIDDRNKIYESDLNNFAPRLGFAYSPSSRTVIRGGSGIFYDQILGSVVSQSRNVFPTFNTVNFGGGTYAGGGDFISFFNPRDASLDPVTGSIFNPHTFSDISFLCPSCIPLIRPGTINVLNPAMSAQQLQTAFQNIFARFPSGSLFETTLPARELATPNSRQFSLGIEQNLFKNTFLSVAYVATTGRNLLRFATPNLGANFVSRIDGFGFGQCLIVFIGGCSPVSRSSTTAFAPRPVPNAGAINQFETTGRSQYHSLQSELRGRLAERFQYRANYVYGKVKDDVSDVFDLAGSFALPQNSLTFDGEYAPANFDVRHRFTYNFVYDSPDLKNKGVAARFLLGGWQIAGMGKFSTGQPFTVNSIVDINQDGNLTDRLNSTQFIIKTGDRRQPIALSPNSVFREMLAQFGQDGAVPRNSFRAGNVLELDLSFTKRFPVTNTQNLSLRVDILNFINRSNFGVPVRFLEAAGFGRVTETLTPGRRVQIGLKYSF